MALPQTNYIDAGPGVPLANPSSAMAQGKAYAEMGNTIAAIGERGMEIAGRVRQIDETGKLRALYATMEKDAADFQIGLMTREDTTDWPAEWKKRSEQWRGQAEKLGLSPEALRQFDEHFTDWNTRRSISFETQAATKTIELGRARISNAMAFNLESGNYDGAIEDARAAHSAGILSSPELDKAINEIGRKRTHDAILSDIDDDPVGWLDTHKEPPPGYDRSEWNRVQAHARGVARQKTYDVSATVQDKIVTGEISRPEQIEEAAAELRPTERAELADFLGKWQDAEQKNLLNDPEHQAGVLGEFERQLSDYKPAAGDSEDMPGVRLGNLVAMMPQGALRDDMERRLKFVRDNQQVEAQSQLDLMLDQVTAYAKQGKFGTVPETEISVEQRVRGGFLRNDQTLRDLGFSDDQVDKFTEAKTDTERRRLLQEMWTSRGDAKKDIDPLTWRTAEAIRDGDSSFVFGEAEALAKQADIDIKTGKIRAHMKEWTRLNPEAARDPEKIRAELHKFTGLEIRKPVTRITPKPKPPMETSMRGPGVNPAIDPLYRTVSAQFPSVENWGIWGDKAHKARKSDHNTGDAIDIAIKDNDGKAVASVIEANAADHNVKYIIHNGRIWKPSTGWQSYTGKDPHAGHVHVSFNRPDKSMASR